MKQVAFHYPLWSHHTVPFGLIRATTGMAVNTHRALSLYISPHGKVQCVLGMSYILLWNCRESWFLQPGFWDQMAKVGFFPLWKLESCSLKPTRKTLWIIYLFITAKSLVKYLSFQKEIGHFPLLAWKSSDSSVHFSRSVVSNSLQSHEPQHARPPCPSPTLRVHPNPCPLSRWCHPTISSSVIPWSSCPQSFPASGSSPVSQLFASGGQSIGVLAPTSVLQMITQDWSPLGWAGWISLQSKELLRVFSNTTVQKHQFFGAQLSL